MHAIKIVMNHIKRNARPCKQGSGSMKRLYTHTKDGEKCVCCVCCRVIKEDRHQNSHRLNSISMLLVVVVVVGVGWGALGALSSFRYVSLFQV